MICLRSFLFTLLYRSISFSVPRLACIHKFFVGILVILFRFFIYDYYWHCLYLFYLFVHFSSNNHRYGSNLFDFLLLPFVSAVLSLTFYFYVFFDFEYDDCPNYYDYRRCYCSSVVCIIDITFKAASDFRYSFYICNIYICIYIYIYAFFALLL